MYSRAKAKETLFTIGLRSAQERKRFFPTFAVFERKTIFSKVRTGEAEGKER
jgi:hypothetical protein